MNTEQASLVILLETIAKMDDNRRGQVVADLAIFTLLVDAKLATIEQVCERLELIQSSLGELYQTDEAKLRTRALTDWLRAHDKPDEPRWTPVVIEGGKDQG